MKFIVLFLGSTTLVAGGTAITPQQDVRNNVIANQRPHQETRAASRGTDCAPVETPIFDNVPYPLAVENTGCHTWLGIDVDLDGDGNSERCFAQYNYICGKIYNTPANVVKYVEDSNPPMIYTRSFLDVSPEVMQYDGITGYIQGIWLQGYLDVTSDGKPDAILLVRTSEEECPQGSELMEYNFYVENISEWPAACASDINNDGSTNVNDLLEVVGNWGPCE